MAAEDPERVDLARDATAIAPPSPAPPLADQLARADLKARLFGAPAESARVGRFAVLRKIGAGGMGVVYAAYDEELDRKLAIKLVKPGQGDPDARARSRREAQALARLSHPNVVQVYEVGEYQGQVYLAMEFVQGQTLRAWQDAAPRHWRDTTAMYLQAGRGLAAAHARGLVHRDFKPDNVLVGDDDLRPRVLDFGLARAQTIFKSSSEPTADPDLSERPAAADLSERTSLPDLSERTAADDGDPGADLGSDPTVYSPGAARLTTPGAVVGTPAYMAPEQLAGGEADARSDIFSFCAALYEALHGERPFTGEDPEALRRAIERGALERTARSAGVPAWLQRVLERGLQFDPSARWPAMEPLLAALARDPTRWRRRAALAVLALALLTAGVLALLAVRERRQDADLAAQRARTSEAEAATALAQAAADAEQRRGEARRLAAQADLQAERDPVLRLLLASEAVAVHTRGGAPPLLEAEQALLDALDSVRSAPFLRPGAAVVDVVAESPDGRWLATGERGGAVTLWATTDPRRPIALRADDGRPVRSLAFSPDATRLAAALADGPETWTVPPVPSDISPVPSATPPIPPPRPVPSDTSPAPPTRPVPSDTSPAPPTRPGPSDTSPVPPTQPVPPDIQPVRWDSPVADLRDLEWAPDGRALLARAGELAVVLRPDGARVLRGHTAAVRRAVWSPDGAEVLTASADGSARLWPAAGGASRVLRLPGSDGARGLWSAEFSPDGREVALASADHTAAIVPLRGGAPLRLRGHTDEVYAASFSADGALLVTVAMDATARVWERDGGSDVIALPGHADLLGGVRIDATRGLLLGTPAGGAAWVWQVDQPGAPLVLRGHRGSVVSARFSADGRRIVTASADGSARRWHLGDDPDLLRGHAAGLEHASFAPDGRTVATASMDGTARVWPRDGRPAVVLRGHREGSSIAAGFSPDGLRLATAGADGLARLWSLTSEPPALLATLPAEPERGASLLDLQWRPDGRALALAADDGRIHLVRLGADGRPTATDLLTGHVGPVRALAFAPDGAHLASAGDDAIVRVWLLAPPPVLSDSLTGHTAAVRSLAFTADSEALLSAGDDTTARVWSLAEPAPPRVLRGHLGAIWQVRADPLRGAVITASADGTARIWPADDGPPAVLAGHGDAVWVAAPSPDGAQILTTSSDGTARLWRPDGADYRALRLPQSGAPVSGDADRTVWLGSFSPDGRLALTAGADGVARVFPVTLAAQLAEACARAGRNLGADDWTRHIGARPYRRTCPDLPDG